MPANKVIIVTGGTSGIGLETCRELAKLNNVYLVIAGRDKTRVDNTVADIKKIAAKDSGVEGAIVDIASLKSVRAFAEVMRQRDQEIFSLVCNAGIQVTKKRHTVDGFEATVGTNYIGHFLLIKLLQDRVKRVITSCSETHDPAERTGVSVPNVSDLEQMARGYESFNPREAYSTSKLCCILLVKELVRRFPKGPEGIAYSPGFTPGTGLARELPSALVSVAVFIARIIHWIRGKRVSTPEYSGAYQASLAAADSLEAKGWHSGDYISIDRAIDASEQARDPALGKALWDKSEEWVRPFGN